MDESIQIHFALAQPFACKRRPAFPFHKVHFRRPGLPRPRPVQRHPRLTLFVVLLCNGLCLALFGRAVYEADNLVQAQENRRNYLQVDHSSPKFKVTSAELPVVTDEAPAPKLPAPSSEPPLLEPVKNEVPAKPAAPPTLPAPPEPPRALAPVDHVDPLDLDWEPILAYTSPLEPPRGDTPMLRNWKMLELAALFAVVVPSPIVLAGDNEKNDTKKILEKLESLDKNVKTVKAKVDGMDAGLKASFPELRQDMKHLKEEIAAVKAEHLKFDSKVDKLEKSLARVKMELEDLKKASRPSLSPLDKADLEELRNRLTSIEQSLAKMQTQTRVSLSPAQPSTGRIMLQNLYTEKLLFRINDREFFVDPQQQKLIQDVPAGSFTYRVFSQQYGWLEPNAQTRQLAPNEVFSLTATMP